VSDPEIYIVVHHQNDVGKPIRSARVIDYTAWRTARFPGQIAAAQINAMLDEVGAPGGEQGLQSDARGIDTPLPRQG
jgi:hypothetical protein